MIQSTRFILAVAAAWIPVKTIAVCEKFDSNMGATFDVTDLIRYIFKSYIHDHSVQRHFYLLWFWLSNIRTSSEYSYMITDGDIPCTTAVIFIYMAAFLYVALFKFVLWFYKKYSLLTAERKELFLCFQRLLRSCPRDSRFMPEFGV